MTTLTIKLPDPLTQQWQASGLSEQELEAVFIRFVEQYLETAQATPQPIDPEQFARHVVSNNRQLFEALAQL